MRKIYLATLMLLIFNLSRAQNVVLLTENFSYPADTTLQANGWFGHSAATTNPIRVTNGGLGWTASNYLGSNIGNAAAVNNTGSDENRPFSSYVNSGSIYVSFLARVNGAVTSTNAGYFLHIGEYADTLNPVFTSISTAFRARTYKAPGSTAAKFRFGLTFNSGTVPATVGTDLSSDLDTGTTYLVVVKYRFYPGATNNDSVSMYVFSQGDSLLSEPATPTVGPLGGSAPDMTYGQYLALRQYNAGQRVIVDGILVQTTWRLTPTVAGIANRTHQYSFAMYPNPAQDLLNIEWDETQSGPQQIRIYNALGQEVYRSKAETGNERTTSLQLPYLTNGMYAVTIEGSKGFSSQTLQINR
jgi:hypothetical protein